mmetsp:Transcript_9736/g.29014  ORF Transcript_9736/g.29014 Transcript_9736/m.29014 type:complete len:173 (-) Transcript_9736:403-921(-)|eukprot:CAMPEP_0172365946 /NCGR_PEP_ID=MMETSP1060-20121228/12616_1 /TAXON_ID=37318 /ORGANISM="Pseudo-nitzschia pungens, Strain cf. cingulata" /LENGTH=172 /DNA_ID=CAMNT_0013089555 /DNA_START=153 /DNA_END=671 /DNA_ORIENTATION=+
MTDVESSGPSRGNSRPNNPYSDSARSSSRWDPINVLWRTLCIGVSLHLLHHMDAYHTIMHSPEVSHEWFKVGLAASIALFSIKGYVEMYTGKLKKQEVSYKTVPQLTHAAIFFIFLSGIAFHIALWPVYGAKSMFIMFLVGAVLLNFCLMFPTMVQNIVAIVLFTFFLQEYH